MTVKIVKTGNLTLIDTPGTNDPDKKRKDEQIQTEFINTIQANLTSQHHGISTFTQTIMPDAGGRIRRSSIDSMCMLLLSLCSMYKNADIRKHPRMCVVFNNVSKHPHKQRASFQYGMTDQIENKVNQEEVRWDEYVTIYKDALKEALEEFYQNAMEHEFIVDLIEILFPRKNFYFYQIREDEEEIKLEQAQIETFIRDNINAPRVYIESGILEPVHLSLKESGIMITGM